jgi:hypothetical protein
MNGAPTLNYDRAPFMSKYGKISTIVMFNAPKILPGEEHRSRSVKINFHKSEIFLV